MQLERLNYKSAGAVRNRAERPTEMREYISSAAEKFPRGTFVTTWNGTANVVGVTLAIKDPQEANPLIQVKWIPSLEVEWVRAEYLDLATLQEIAGTPNDAGGRDTTPKALPAPRIPEIELH